MRGQNGTSRSGYFLRFTGFINDKNQGLDCNSLNQDSTLILTNTKGIISVCELNG